MKKGQKKGNDGDDRAVWEYVTRSVRPYGKKAVAAAKTAPKTAAKTAAKASFGPEKPPARPVPPPRIPAPAAPKPFDKGEEEALRKGRREVEATLDLHGMTQSEAYDALHRAVRHAQRDDRRTLLVITGKGRVGGGVLRRLLPLWLEEGELRSSVLAFSAARPEDGGGGAFYLRLRKKK